MSWFYLLPYSWAHSAFLWGPLGPLCVFLLHGSLCFARPGGWGEVGRLWGQHLCVIFWWSGRFSWTLSTAHSSDSDLARRDSCFCLKRNLSSWTCTFKILLMNLIISWETTRILWVAHIGYRCSFRSKAGSLQMSQDRWRKQDTASVSELQSCENLRFRGGVILFLERTSARMRGSLHFSGEGFSFSFLQILGWLARGNGEL